MASTDSADAGAIDVGLRIRHWPVFRVRQLVPALLIACVAPAAAQTKTWDGGAANSSWSASANWNPNGVPSAGETVIVSGGGGANQPILNVASAFISQTIVSAGSLTIDNVLTSPVTISGSGSVTINAGAGIVGNVAKDGTGTLTTSGTITGELGVAGGVASNAGVVTGATTISGGTLNLNQGSNLSDALAFTVNGGLVNVNSAEIAGPLSGNGGMMNFVNNIAFTTNVSGTSSWPGDMGGTMSTANSAYFVKAGAGTLTLRGLSSVAGPGRIAVSAGTLVATGGNAIANSSNVAVASGATFRLDASETIGALSGTSGGTVVLGGNTVTIAGMAPGVAAFTSPAGISGTGGVTLNAPGFTQTLTGANAYTGATTVTAGTLRLGASNVIANGSGLLLNGGTFDVSTQTDTVAGISLQSGSVVGTGVLTSTSPIDARSGSVSAGLAGLVALVKTTAGTVGLTGANAYLGSTTVSAGILDLTGTGSVVSSAINVAAGTLNVDSGALPASAALALGTGGTLGTAGTIVIGVLTQTGGVLSATGPSTINLSGAFTQSGGTSSGSLDINAATFTQSGNATIAAGTNVTAGGTQTLQGGSIAGVLDGLGAVRVSAGSTVVTGRIDATSLTVSGAGVLRAGGAALSGAASLTLTGGSWEMTAPTMLQSLQVSPGGRVDFGAFSGAYKPLMVADFTGGGIVELNAFLEGSASPSDQLVVTNSAVGGTTTLRVRNSGGLGAETTGSGILLIEINGASSADAFVLAAPGFMQEGDYRYSLVKVGNNWFLQSQFTGLFQDGFE